MTIREEIIEVVTLLFIYTDNRNWEGLQNEAFTQEVFLDMTSLGGEAKEMAAIEICNMWNEGFKGIDAINHLAGNYLVQTNSNDTAQVFAYATAHHYKKDAKNGPTREFVGTYDIHLSKGSQGWRILKLTYHLKYMTGNLTLE